MTSRRRAAGVLAAVLILPAGPAGAHAFGARYDLPLPLIFYLAAAGLAVAVSFLAAAAFLRTGRTIALGVDLPVPAALRAVLGPVCRAAGLGALAIVLAVALFGPAEPTKNLATITVWVLWWVGFLLFSALVLDLWADVDPFRTLHLLLAAAAGRDPEAGATLPRAAGLLAPAGLLAIGWVELVSDASEDPRALATLIVAYAGVSVAAGLLFGLRWFREADPLGRLFDLLGRMAPLCIGSQGALRIRPPGEGLLEAGPPRPGEAALVIVLIGLVLFDGFSETPAWAGLLDLVSQSQTLRGTLLAVRDAGVDLLKLIRTVGLFATVLAFYALYRLLALAMRLAARAGPPAADYAAAFASSLLPIAIAYHFSHYFSYLLMAGQLAAPAGSDPFALGWDLFGARERTIDVSVIGAEQIWWLAIAALVAGHSLSVLIGHRRAIALLGDARAAGRSQVPMMVCMVGLTVLSLWILSQPITQ